MNRSVNSFVTHTSAKDGRLTSSDSFSQALSYGKSEIAALQTDLARLSGFSAHANILWTEYCSQLFRTLFLLQSTTSELHLMLSRAVSLGHEIAISPQGCELVIILCYVQEQINLLRPLIDAQCSIDKLKSKQLAKSRQEVSTMLSVLLEGVDVILQILKDMIMLCDQKRFYERNQANSASLPQ
jgi:hypothetical protein